MRRLLVLTVLLAGCASGEAPDDVPTESSTQGSSTTESSAPSLEAPPLSPDQSAAHTAFLSPAASEAALAHRSAAFAAVSVADFEALWTAAFALGEVLIHPDSASAYGDFSYRFQTADLGIPGVGAGCVAECTEPALILEREGWEEIAARTEGDLDDAFVALVFDHWDYPAIYEGQLNGWPTYFERTWDYGGYSLLGEGRHTALLERVDALRARTPEAPPFEQTLTLMRESIVGDAAGSACFGPSADLVMQEMEALVNLDGSNELSDRLAEMRAGERFEPGCAAALDCSCASG